MSIEAAKTYAVTLNARDFVIYPGKVSNAGCFRIGNIGRIIESDVHKLLAAIAEALAKMEIGRLNCCIS